MGKENNLAKRARSHMDTPRRERPTVEKVFAHRLWHLYRLTAQEGDYKYFRNEIETYKAEQVGETVTTEIWAVNWNKRTIIVGRDKKNGRIVPLPQECVVKQSKNGAESIRFISARARLDIYMQPTLALATLLLLKE